jgi:hypothetical protein
MVQVAMHLVTEVLPRVPFRQWVVVLPKRLRGFAHHNPKRASAITGIALRTIESVIRRHCELAPPGARAGGIAFAQRFGGSINAHWHIHIVMTDGVYALDDHGALTFYQAVGLDNTTADDVTHTLRHRVLRHLQRQGCLDADDVDTLLGWDHHSGFSVDNTVSIPHWDRAGLERLVRYCARHPFAKGRLRLGSDDHVVYQLREPDVGGRTQIRLHVFELFDRLAELIVPPRIHRHRYFGCLAPASPLRPLVTLTAGDAQPQVPSALPAPPDDETPADPEGTSQSLSPCSSLWALLIARTYEVLPILCTRCGTEMKLVAFITQPPVIQRILAHIGEPADPPVLAPARGPPQTDFDFDQSPELDDVAF